LTAVRVIEETVFDFSAFDGAITELSRLSWIARCLRYDRLITDFLERNEEGTVVNIGCGLDTTYERIGSPKVHWYDLDLPAVVALRRRFLPETECRIFLEGSFLDRDLYQKIDRRRNVLFISAGVFPYFTAEEMQGFFRDLSDRFAGAELFFDVTSSHGVRAANQVLANAGLDEGCRMKWALERNSVLLSWDSRLELLKTYNTFRIGGLEMKAHDRFLGTVSDFLGIQRMLHLRIRRKS
jgi:O-methyltransferase involved in polyketide biosynthesis